jgi:hypothetical protein
MYSAFVRHRSTAEIGVRADVPQLKFDKFILAACIRYKANSRCFRIPQRNRNLAL